MNDNVDSNDKVASGMIANAGLSDALQLPPAIGLIQHLRDGKVIAEETVHNVKTTAGIDFLFAQGYGTSGGQANGLCYIGLSNDTLTETTASTTLSTEITTNGLARAVGTYAHTAGTSTATITKTFTASGAQSAQKAALFSASSAGTMTHVLSFTQRSLQNGDQLAITFTITLS
jgi:hypothetical protein